MKGEKTKHINVYVSPDELDTIRRMARDRGLATSVYLRTSALGQTFPPLPTETLKQLSDAIDRAMDFCRFNPEMDVIRPLITTISDTMTQYHMEMITHAER